MSIKRIITNIPPEKLDFVIAAVKVDDGIVTQQLTEDGEITIIAEFPAIDVQPELPAEGVPEFSWMTIAEKEIGTKEIPGAGSNPEIEKYHATTSLGSKSDAVPWCSSFVNFCITKSGLKGTNSAQARSWVAWGKEISSFVPGCIVVLERGKPPNGHVGFFVGMDGSKVRLLGGNQSDSVNIASFDSARVIAKRLPDNPGT